MKRFLILVLMVVCLFPVNAQAKQGRRIDQKKYCSMRTQTIKTGKKYRVDVFWRWEKISSYMFNQKPQVKFIKNDKLTRKMLVNRKNKILYIEVDTGTQINEKGDGKIDTKNPYYNYISYKRCGFKKGDRIRTYCIYNPYTNWEDDIIERYDEEAH